MTETVKTNEALVIDVGPEGATIAFNGQNQLVRWGTLRAAARQEDAELRRVYSRLLQDAEALADKGPLTVTVEQDYTDVWWVVKVRANWGGMSACIRWLSDEGGTHGRYHLAAEEARGIAKRLQKQGRQVTLRV